MASRALAPKSRYLSSRHKHRSRAAISKLVVFKLVAMLPTVMHKKKREEPQSYSGLLIMVDVVQLLVLDSAVALQNHIEPKERIVGPGSIDRLIISALERRLLAGASSIRARQIDSHFQSRPLLSIVFVSLFTCSVSFRLRRCSLTFSVL